jgi:hypothetical protein
VCYTEITKILDENNIKIKWSESENSVSILIDNYETAYIDITHLKSYNVNILEDCGWGGTFVR